MRLKVVVTATAASRRSISWLSPALAFASGRSRSSSIAGCGRHEQTADGGADAAELAAGGDDGGHAAVASDGAPLAVASTHAQSQCVRAHAPCFIISAGVAAPPAAVAARSDSGDLLRGMPHACFGRCGSGALRTRRGSPQRRVACCTSGQRSCAPRVVATSRPCRSRHGWWAAGKLCTGRGSDAAPADSETAGKGGAVAPEPPVSQSCRFDPHCRATGRPPPPVAAQEEEEGAAAGASALVAFLLGAPGRRCPVVCDRGWWLKPLRDRDHIATPATCGSRPWPRSPWQPLPGRRNRRQCPLCCQHCTSPCTATSWDTGGVAATGWCTSLLQNRMQRTVSHVAATSHCEALVAHEADSGEMSLVVKDDAPAISCGASRGEIPPALGGGSAMPAPGCWWRAGRAGVTLQFAATK